MRHIICSNECNDNRKKIFLQQIFTFNFFARPLQFPTIKIVARRRYCRNRFNRYLSFIMAEIEHLLSADYVFEPS